MNAIKKLGLASVAAALLIPVSQLSYAGSVSQNIGVSATIENNCEIKNVTDVDLGSYDSVLATAVTGQGSFTLTCTAGTASVLIGLDDGLNPSGGINRALDSVSGAFLNYALYQSPGTTEPWTDTDRKDVSTEIDGTPHTHTVYSIIGAGQTGKPAGTYTDTVAITVTF